MEKSESKGAFPCIIVYSSDKHVAYINPVLDAIEHLLKNKGFEPILLGDEVRSGDDYFNKLEELIDKSVLGIVILDGFRPNVLFEFGYLKGKGKPTIILKSSQAYINVKTLYANNHGLTNTQFNRLNNPKIDLSRHLSDFIKHIAIFEWNARYEDQNHISKVLEEELKKFDNDIRNEAQKILTKGVSSDHRFIKHIENLVSSIFNAEEYNLNMVKSIHREIEEFAKSNNIQLTYDILKSIAEAYEAVAERSHQLDTNSKIEAYESALNMYDDIINKFKDDKEIYASAHFKIGYLSIELITYKGLDKKKLVKKAIKAYEEALTIRTKDKYPLDYAMTLNNLGNAYRTLAEVEDKAENCKKAIKAYEEALTIRTKDKYPLDYAMTLNNLGNAYRTLAEVEDKAENCKKAIKAYEEALTIRTKDKYPLDYAMTLNNLGIAYRTLAEVEDKAENCKKAIKAYEEALEIVKDIPYLYNIISKNLDETRRKCS
ncbi:MAG: hypothetical protein KatS3mg003_1389 [Candidatus Nitrosocaldaceae archaeon]|nr:MAG: hypothetical protein KatS3mg003_1389 [Candidatus Nitrosocaldaceae archaeon]